MDPIFGDVTSRSKFFGNTDPYSIVEKYGSPLYVYNESILRQRCRDMKNLVDYPRFQISYSAKANSNIALLQIIREEGLRADAMSTGEIHVQLAAGFKPEEIFFVPNNVAEEELRFALDRGILISADSLSQLAAIGRIATGSRVALRFNPGVGAGHHRNVVTAGKDTKFGVEPHSVPDVKEILQDFRLKLVGINQHIGSLFMEPDPYLAGAKALLEIAGQFDDLEFVDLGGGFGVPYRKLKGQERIDLKKLGRGLSRALGEFAREYGREIAFHVEPGRYVAAECGVLLGTVYALKESWGKRYAGTDLGFNTLMRPVLYGSHHDIEVFRRDQRPSERNEEVTVVGNICETGDILAAARELPALCEGDILCVLDAGAYGFAMTSNYNCRLRPAEVLIREDGRDVLIRRRDSLEDLTKNCMPLPNP
jgi:diaminopimelate decarboxylase